MKNLAILIIALFVANFTNINATFANTTKGTNAKVVDYGRNSQKLGFFTQIATNKWMEKGENTYYFNETHRDEWSVYLKDNSRGVNIQLDLHTKKVMYSDSNSPRRELYDVMHASAKVGGYLAKVVSFEGGGKHLGYFKNTNGKSWVETGTSINDTRFNFTEVGRDEWSVYLKDASRGVNIQLDLHTMKVMYSDANSARRELYTISGTRYTKQAVVRPTGNVRKTINRPARRTCGVKTVSKPTIVNGYSVKTVAFTHIGQTATLGYFKQTSGKNWVETGTNINDTRFNFTEVARDEWSVYLKDASRGVNIQLDLHTKKVMYSAANQSIVPLYAVSKAK